MKSIAVYCSCHHCTCYLILRNCRWSFKLTTPLIGDLGQTIDLKYAIREQEQTAKMQSGMVGTYATPSFRTDCYLPVRGVLKELSQTTKFYIWNFAGVYLISLVHISFCRHFIAMTLDVSQMFEEILLHSNEKDFHQYLACNSQGNIEDWHILCLTFRVASSPILAMSVLCQLAEDNKDYPIVSSIILTLMTALPAQIL